MRDRKVKTEKYMLWFSDLPGTAQLLEEKSAEGWHIASIDIDTGKFTYHKGGPTDYDYEFVVNGGTDNLAVFQDDYEQVLTETGLALYRREEDSPASYESVKKAFHGSDRHEEEQWLREMAAKGEVLVRASRPEYVFAMGENADITYRIDYREKVSDPDAYLAPFRAAGWEYVCGGKGYHYFSSERQKPEDPAADESTFDERENTEEIRHSKTQQAGTILFVSVAGLLGALVKLFFDVRAFSNGAGETQPVMMDLLAGVICFGFLIGCLVYRMRVKRQ